MMDLDIARKGSNRIRRATEIVKCEICGGNYNRSYLNSHKRLAHKKNLTAAQVTDEAEAINAILAVCSEFSPRGKKLVLDRLSASLND